MIKIVEKNEYYCDICKNQIAGPSDLIEIKTHPYEDRGDDGQRYTLTRHVCVHCFEEMPLFDFHLNPFDQLIADLRSAGLSHKYGYDEDGDARYIYYPRQNPKYEVYSPDGNILCLRDRSNKVSKNYYKPVTLKDAFNTIFTAWYNDYTDARRKEIENGTKE